MSHEENEDEDDDDAGEEDDDAERDGDARVAFYPHGPLEECEPQSQRILGGLGKS